MGNLVERGLPCPHCRSSDARAEYEDNYFCFSCKKSDKKFHMKSKYTQPKINGPTKPYIPENCDDKVQLEMRAWLYKHYFTDELIDKYRIKSTPNFPYYSNKNGWVGMGPRLILPQYQGEELLFVEARSFTEGDARKYITVGGKKDPFFSIAEDECGTMVIVEDMVSAMRVGEILPCVALRGTRCSDYKYSKIVKRAKAFLVWLDSDSPGQTAAKELIRKLTWAGKTYKIISNSDPKCYSDEQIRKYCDAGIRNLQS